jgi:uncharacterized protein (TIGR04562 family)
MSNMKNASVFEQYNLPWEMIRHAFSGRSIVDTQYAVIGSLEDAEEMIRAYGYDWQSEKDREFLQDIYAQALEFIQKQLIEPFEEPLVIPELFESLDDFRELLFYASDKQEQLNLQLWACALLKVVHTMLHLRNDVLEEYFHEARMQIFNRFNGHLFIDERENIYLGQERDNLIPLYYFKVKKNKNFTSQLIKLLHKAENTSAGIYDKIGVRIVTHSLTDVLLVFSYLLSSKIFTLANITPQRSRNSLLSLSAYQEYITGQLKEFSSGRIGSDELLARVNRELPREYFLKQELEDGKRNPNSLSGYRSVQLTCRHLIRFPNPQFVKMTSLRERLIQADAPHEIVDQTEDILQGVQPELSFFFPFEIQLMDKDTFLTNQYGEGSHAEYKQNQLVKARKRVLGKLLTGRQSY